MYISSRLNPGKSFKSKAGKGIRRWLAAGLILAFVLLLGFCLLVRALPQIAINQIVELTDAEVEAKSVDVSLDGSIFIEELVIAPPQQWRPCEPILKAETVYARFDLASLLLMSPRLKEINVDGFVFHALYDCDIDRWNVRALKIKPGHNGYAKMPLVQLERGTLKYSKILSGNVKAVAAVPIRAGFQPSREMPDGCGFSITTAKMAGGFGDSTLTGNWRPGSVSFAGGISSTNIPALERACSIDLLAAVLNYDASGDYSLEVRIRDMLSERTAVSDASAWQEPEFLKSLKAFSNLQKFFSRYDPQGWIDIDVTASGNFKHLSAGKFGGTVTCKDVSICDRKFPYPVEHITGQIALTENSVRLDNLSGRHGEVRMNFNGWTIDSGSERQYDIEVTSDNMVLNSDLYKALNPKHKKLWDSFSPKGVVGIDYHLRRLSPDDKRKALTVELLGTQGAYRNFPYPLKNVAGRLHFEHGQIIFSDVVSEYDGRGITINGKVVPQETGRATCVSF
ncbi:MAG: hypothetical protein ACYS4W_04765 [Planctomycetota bacterium]|jgi:hypothetical protein